MTQTLPGLMSHAPLLVSSLIDHAARHHRGGEIVSRLGDGSLHRYRYPDCRRRAMRLASALERSGVQPGTRVATIAWNGFRHLELYFGVGGMGAVCHTINPRLHPDQIAYIIRDAADQMVFFDVEFAGLVGEIAGLCPEVRHWVALCDAHEVPAGAKLPLESYEALLETGGEDYQWPVFDESAACGLCYTSGTTGQPKGVLYTNRSTVLHAYAASLPNAMNLSSHSVVMPVVPMFHVNAWGIPYAAPLNGAKLVLPGRMLDGASLHALIEAEGVTFAAGVPTIWLSLLEHVERNSGRFDALREAAIGGSACPASMVDRFHALGVDVVPGWGMTETSPLGCLSRLSPGHTDLPLEERRRILQKQGHALFGIDMKIVDGRGAELPWDGRSFGDLMVRGPWVLERYYGADRPAGEGGWFATGDVATIDPGGAMQIMDRTKDIIKSGGEWISSIDVESIAMAHPDLLEAACIAAEHPKWGERPLLIAVARPGAEVSAGDVLRFFEGKAAKWWIPDEVVFVESLPHNATGKVQKRDLRERYAGLLA